MSSGALRYMQPPDRPDLVDQWSELKKRILKLSDAPPAPNPARTKGYKDVFKTLDQNLSGQLRAVDRAAIAARDGDPQARADFRAALKAAFDTIEKYNQHLDFIADAFVKEYNARGSWDILRQVLNRIRDDIGRSLAAIPW